MQYFFIIGQKNSAILQYFSIIALKYCNNLEKYWLILWSRVKKMMIHWNKSWHEFPFQLTPPSDWQKIQLLYEEFHVTITIDAKRFSLIISSALFFSGLHRAVNWNWYFLWDSICLALQLSNAQNFILFDILGVLVGKELN